MTLTQEYDVVIVGSGVGGSTAAWALAQAGKRVLVLEAGPRYAPKQDYKLSLEKWEQPFPHKVSPENRYSFGKGQSLSQEYNDLRSWNHLHGRYNKTDHRIYYNYHRVIGVGGSSLHFTGEAHRLNPLSMKMHSRFGVAADWPLSYDDLEPYYSRAEKIVGVAGPDNELTRPRSHPYPQAPHAFSYASQKLRNGFTKNSLSYVANSLAVLSAPKEERENCNYCGGCLRGCPRGDKGSMDVSYLRLAEQTGRCVVQAETVVIRIISGPSQTIKGVECLQKGKRFFIKTPRLIMACGAVETPRLLLHSASEQAPQGLANESGQVGKNFMETILWTSSGLHPEKLGSHRGLPVDGICWDYNAPDAIEGVIGGCRFSPSLAESDLVGPVAYATRVVGGWGYDHKRKMKQSFGHMLSVSGIGESLPNEGTFISLDRERKDEFGIPLAKISSHLDEMAIKRIAFMAKICRQVLKTAGVREIIEEFSSYDIFSSTHVFGTCRMGLEKNNSVVDPNCRSHLWKNLYVMDGSIFPSSGGGESPGLTIQALSLRACEHMLRQQD